MLFLPYSLPVPSQQMTMFFIFRLSPVCRRIRCRATDCSGSGCRQPSLSYRRGAAGLRRASFALVLPGVTMRGMDGGQLGLQGIRGPLRPRDRHRSRSGVQACLRGSSRAQVGRTSALHLIESTAQGLVSQRQFFFGTRRALSQGGRPMAGERTLWSVSSRAAAIGGLWTRPLNAATSLHGPSEDAPSRDRTSAEGETGVVAGRFPRYINGDR